MKATVALCLLLLFSAYLCKAQTVSSHHTITISKICSYSPSPEADKACESTIEIRYDDLPQSDTLSKSIMKVLTLNGLRENSMSIGVIDNLLVSGMYCKPTSDNIPRLLISRKYTADYWVAMGILLHELGHLLNHHENICSNIQLESDADLFDGRCLATLRATQTEALKCVDLLAKEVSGSDRYPSKKERINNVLTGYNSFLRTQGVQSFTSVNPEVRWKWIDSDGHYDIYIDRDTIAVPYTKYYLKFDGGAIDPVQGILYIEKTNSTYFLMNLTDHGQGIGQLVNDKTSLVYKRFGKSAYRVYDKALIIDTDKVSEIPLDEKDTLKDKKDYEILYKASAQSPSYSKVVFVDYFFTPEKVLRPAFFR